MSAWFWPTSPSPGLVNSLGREAAQALCLYPLPLGEEAPAFLESAAGSIVGLRPKPQASEVRRLPVSSAELILARPWGLCQRPCSPRASTATVTDAACSALGNWRTLGWGRVLGEAGRDGQAPSSVLDVDPWAECSGPWSPW